MTVAPEEPCHTRLSREGRRHDVYPTAVQMLNLFSVLQAPKFIAPGRLTGVMPQKGLLWQKGLKPKPMPSTAGKPKGGYSDALLPELHVIIVTCCHSVTATSLV